MFKISWKLSVITLVSIPIIAIASNEFGEKFKEIAEKVQNSLAKANEDAEETISNMRTVRSFAAEDQEIKRYAENQANAGDSTAYDTNQLQRTFLAQFYSLETLCVEKSTQLVNCEPICVKQCCRNTCANLFGMQSVATSPSDGITKCYRQCFYSCFFQGCRSDPFRCWRSLVSRGHW